ncbi:protein TMEPAI-like isoform X1 [Hippocampus comes]|uniref:protein TMEPAI-like isoform X1 n=2 Tax=Hippocampus comes TaxID=109280 RepID=UPI00094E6154|nr:PREDICTED: protein TMEPAI-like isoform X1 [Hippocampus comes]
MSRARVAARASAPCTSWTQPTVSHYVANSVPIYHLAQLELVQLVVIVVVMMVMVVVVTCVLNHYRLSARSLLSRQAPLPGAGPRQNLAVAAGLWSSECPSGVRNDHGFHPRGSERGAPYLPRRFPQSCPPPVAARFQPTFPFLRHDLIMDLPPTISLSDGEEPPPYQGPCTLQLRDPEQQMELNRESVRPPPNRTVFDSHPLDPPTSCVRASLQATRQQKQKGAPPTYSEVLGHLYHPLPEVDSRNARNTKGKSSDLRQV